MAEVFFFLAAIGALAGALATVLVRNPFYSVLALVCHLHLARGAVPAAARGVRRRRPGDRLRRRRDGALRVRRRLHRRRGPAGARRRRAEPPLGSLLFAGALFVELCIAFLGTGLTILGEERPRVLQRLRHAAEMGRLFLTDFLLAFEAASLLLLIAAVGAVILARRRTGPRGRARDLRRRPHAPIPSTRARSATPSAARCWRPEGRRTDEHRVVPRRLGARVLHRARGHPHAPQPAGDPALPRADAQRRQPRARRLLARARATSRARSSR